MKKITTIVKIALLALLTFGLPLLSLAVVGQFSFTTEEQMIKPNTISEALTIQAQNGSGEKENVAETQDLVFISSSATGEFLNSSGNPVSTTMSKNTANRTFYYRDSTVGTHTITVKITGRESQQSFTVSQSITISESASNADKQESQDPTPTTPVSRVATGSNSAANASYAPVNSSLPTLNFQVSAGRDRLVAVGVPLDFRAEVTKAVGLISSINYQWSFGDGATESGLYATHTYQYPGRYIASLNARSGTEAAVSRLSVEVVPVVAVIVQANKDYVEILNSSQNELNLFGWRLVGVGEQFIFPQDTIILPGSKVKFPVSVTKLEGAGNSLVLESPHGKVLATWESWASSDMNQLSEQITKAQADTQALARQMNKITGVNKPASLPMSTPIRPMATSEAVDEQEKITTTPTSSLATIGVLYEAPVSKSLWRRLLSILPWW